MNKDNSIFVAGVSGMVGSAIIRKLRGHGYENILCPTRKSLDLRSQSKVRDWFEENRPEYVFLAAAKVGGILANSTMPAEFIHENIIVQDNVIHSSWKFGVKKLCFLGSSCIYPRLATQPITEQSFLTGSLEPTNEAYAIAKIAGIKTCQAYRRQYGFDAISLMPTNLYGPGDNFHEQDSHVFPALIRRIHEAKKKDAPSVVIWGTGSVKREFLHVDDLADASIFMMNNYSSDEIINIGAGEDISILELARLISDVVGYRGAIEHDLSKPDGAPRKLLDVSRSQALGWSRSIPLRKGVEQTVQWFLDNADDLRK